MHTDALQPEGQTLLSQMSAGYGSRMSALFWPHANQPNDDPANSMDNLDNGSGFAPGSGGVMADGTNPTAFDTSQLTSAAAGSWYGAAAAAAAVANEHRLTNEYNEYGE